MLTTAQIEQHLGQNVPKLIQVKKTQSPRMRVRAPNNNEVKGEILRHLKDRELSTEDLANKCFKSYDYVKHMVRELRIDGQIYCSRSYMNKKFYKLA